MAGHGTVQLVTSFRRYKLLWPASDAASSFTRTAAAELTRLGGRPRSAGPVSPEPESGSGVDGEPVREFCGQPSAPQAERHEPVAGSPRRSGGWSLPATGGADEPAEACQAVEADALGGHGTEDHVTIEQISSPKIVENSRCLLTVEQ